jgi:YD repeat-containing protein
MKPLLFVTVLLVAACQMPLRNAEAQQTRVYDARGNSLGTTVPQGEGSTRYYDSRGRSLGTSTTTGNTTKFYNERGQPTGSTTTLPSKRR